MKSEMKVWVIINQKRFVKRGLAMKDKKRNECGLPSFNIREPANTNTRHSHTVV